MGVFSLRDMQLYEYETAELQTYYTIPLKCGAIRPGQNIQKYFGHNNFVQQKFLLYILQKPMYDELYRAASLPQKFV
jgi:hypothetical protein